MLPPLLSITDTDTFAEASNEAGGMSTKVSEFSLVVAPLKLPSTRMAIIPPCDPMFLVLLATSDTEILPFWLLRSAASACSRLRSMCLARCADNSFFSAMSSSWSSASMLLLAAGRASGSKRAAVRFFLLLPMAAAAEVAMLDGRLRRWCRKWSRGSL